MDPLSSAASLVGMVSLATQVMQGAEQAFQKTRRVTSYPRREREVDEQIWSEVTKINTALRSYSSTETSYLGVHRIELIRSCLETLLQVPEYFISAERPTLIRSLRREREGRALLQRLKAQRENLMLSTTTE